jgi:hypothetical protein
MFVEPWYSLKEFFCFITFFDTFWDLSAFILIVFKIIVLPYFSRSKMLYLLVQMVLTWQVWPLLFLIFVVVHFGVGNFVGYRLLGIIFSVFWKAAILLCKVMGFLKATAIILKNKRPWGRAWQAGMLKQCHGEELKMISSPNDSGEVGNPGADGWFLTYAAGVMPLTLWNLNGMFYHPVENDIMISSICWSWSPSGLG